MVGLLLSVRLWCIALIRLLLGIWLLGIALIRLLAIALIRLLGIRLLRVGLIRRAVGLTIARVRLAVLCISFCTARRYEGDDARDDG